MAERSGAPSGDDAGRTSAVSTSGDTLRKVPRGVPPSRRDSGALKKADPEGARESSPGARESKPKGVDVVDGADGGSKGAGPASSSAEAEELLEANPWDDLAPSSREAGDEPSAEGAIADGASRASMTDVAAASDESSLDVAADLDEPDEVSPFESPPTDAGGGASFFSMTDEAPADTGSAAQARDAAAASVIEPPVAGADAAGGASFFSMADDQPADIGAAAQAQDEAGAGSFFSMADDAPADIGSAPLAPSSSEQVIAPPPVVAPPVVAPPVVAPPTSVASAPVEPPPALPVAAMPSGVAHRAVATPAASAASFDEADDTLATRALAHGGTAASRGPLIAAIAAAVVVVGGIVWVMSSGSSSEVEVAGEGAAPATTPSEQIAPPSQEAASDETNAAAAPVAPEAAANDTAAADAEELPPVEDADATGADPGDPEAVTQYIIEGNRLLDADEAEAAIAQFEKAIELHALNWRALAGLTKANLALHRGKAAVEVAERLALHHPDRAANFLLLGDAYRMKGDKAAAEEAWEKALSMNPESHQAKRRLKR